MHVANNRKSLHSTIGTVHYVQLHTIGIGVMKTSFVFKCCKGVLDVQCHQIQGCCKFTVHSLMISDIVYQELLH